MSIKFSIFETDMGWVTIGITSLGVREVMLPVESRDLALRSIDGLCKPKINIREGLFMDVEASLKRYFKGQPVVFPFPLDLDGYTDFRKNVWNMAKTISYGQLRSYSWLAKQIRNPKAYRAVGNALGKNPIPILIPCHRVIGTDGNLHGFTGGLHWKQKLIELENAQYVK